MKRTLTILLLTLLLTTTAAFAQNDPEAELIATLVAASEPFAAFVDEYPNYEFYTELNGDVWYVELYAVDDDEEIWFGEAWINAETLVIEDYDLAGDDDTFEMEISPEIQSIIDVVATDDAIAANLTQYPNYEAYAFDEGEFVIVEFAGVNEEGDEVFLGEAFVRKNGVIIEEIYAPVFLTDEQIAAQQPQIQQIVEADPSVNALLADLPNPYTSIEYSPGEGWIVYYESGLEVYEVIVGDAEDDEADTELRVLGIRDVAEFDTTEREQILRDQAVTIAFEAEPLERIDLPDEWFTRTSPLGNDLMGVDFITNDGTLILQVIVNTATETVTEVVEP